LGKDHSLTMIHVCNPLKIRGLLPSNFVHKTSFTQKITASERAAEVFQDHATMFGQIELPDAVAEHVVDEPRGQIEQELA